MTSYLKQNKTLPGHDNSHAMCDLRDDLEIETIFSELRSVGFKVIRKFFLNHNKSFRWHLGDYEKHVFFPFEGL